MSKLTSYIYKTAIRIYHIAPYKKFLCFVIKRLKISNNLFYKDLKFTGKFKVKVVKNKSFNLYHYGGTIENETFWKGLFVTWENETGWIWKQLCECSEVIFDIGANTGMYSLITKAINPNASVFAFEPSNNTYKKLVSNNLINKYNIRCEQIAISDNNGEQIFYDTPDPNQTRASLSAECLKNWDGYSGEIVEYKVNTMTLSNYIEINSIHKIDLIKIDIELHEPEAITGLGHYLGKFKPVIIIEVLSDKVAEELNKLIGKDYLIFHLQDNEIAEPVNQFRLITGKWNYIFFHKDLENKIKRCTTLYK